MAAPKPQRDPDVEREPWEVTKGRMFADMRNNSLEAIYPYTPEPTDEELRDALFEWTDAVHSYGPEGHYILTPEGWQRPFVEALAEGNPEHEVFIHEHSTFGCIWRATCSCGFRGRCRDTHEAADVDADWHLKDMRS